MAPTQLIDWILAKRKNSSRGNYVFSQNNGVAQGLHCSNDIADLSLMIYEKEYVEKLLGAGRIDLAVAFGQTFCYVDDAMSWKRGEREIVCEQVEKSAYFDHFGPATNFQLGIEDTTDYDENGIMIQAVHQDLVFSINKTDPLHPFLSYELYDKRKVLPLLGDIPTYDTNHSNTPSNSQDAYYGGQLVRYYRNNLLLRDFASHATDLLLRFRSLGFDTSVVTTRAVKILLKHFPSSSNQIMDTQEPTHEFVTLLNSQEPDAEVWSYHKSVELVLKEIELAADSQKRVARRKSNVARKIQKTGEASTT